jgi:hypothetical protein
MFVAHDVLLDVAFGEARSRLVSLASLASSHALIDASRAAYLEGLASQDGASQDGASQSRAGPPDTRPASDLVRVRFLPPVERADSTTVGMRWEASGVSAGLFPVLDADITLTPASEHTTTLTLSGVYRPPYAQPCPTVLTAPVPAQPESPAAPADPSGLMAEVAVHALLRYAAGYLTR